MTPAQTFLIEQCIQEYNLYTQGFGQSSFAAENPVKQIPLKDNPIRQEFLLYGIKKGWLNKHGFSDKTVQPGIDLLEVYCSADSQLTNQSIRHGLKARRFGLHEGNLSYYEGRCKLYDVLYRCRPRHVWLSPKCQAWCKWNQFNASKSPEMARKVLEAQSEDLVHLQICEAVFAFQCERGDAFHCHLEQPVGSEMLNQDVMQRIVQNTLHAKCDLCKAGLLKHPQTQMPMKKGTLILTTSMIDLLIA